MPVSRFLAWRRDEGFMSPAVVKSPAPRSVSERWIVLSTFFFLSSFQVHCILAAVDGIFRAVGPVLYQVDCQLTIPTDSAVR